MAVPPEPVPWYRPHSLHPTVTYDELVALVHRLSPSRADGSRDEWVKIGMAIHSVDSSERGYDLFAEFSCTSPKFNEKDCRATWRSFKTGSGITVASLIH